MSLTNEQYNLILREYDSRRLKARHELEERIKKAEQKSLLCGQLISK